MTIEIPDKTQGAIERVFSRQAQTATSPDNQPFQFRNPSIVAHDYIQIPGTSRVISRLELPGYNNLNWQDAHFKLHENGLYMPVIPEFIKHFMNVVESYKSKGKKTLFDAKGNPISEKDLQDIYLHLVKHHISAYASQGGARKGVWTWLDAKFAGENVTMKILSEHRTIVTGTDKTLQPRKVENLEAALEEDCLADLEFNSQGLAVKKSGKQNYVRGENLYFLRPIGGKVARFNAGSDGADLNCHGDPSNRNPVLGVFGVADVKQNARP